MHPMQDSVKLTLGVECVWSSHLDVVVWRGHGEVEHARRHVHAVCGHCCIPVCPNVAKMVVSAIVVIIEWTWAYVRERGRGRRERGGGGEEEEERKKGREGGERKRRHGGEEGGREVLYPIYQFLL